MAFRLVLSFFKAIATLVGEFFKLLNQRQLIDAGKAEEAVKEVKELEKRVEMANRAAVPSVDPIRADRLQKRFDRDSSRK